MKTLIATLGLLVVNGSVAGDAVGQTGPGVPMRVATFNVQDLSADEDAERLDLLARFIVRMDADVLLLNEVDTPPEDPLSGVRPLLDLIAEKSGEGANGYTPVVRPTNTGVPSGFDLDNNGQTVSEPGSRAYGGDCFGYGEYPGQYGMVLLVREPFRVDEAGVRTFAEFLWKDMPGAHLPSKVGGEGWYSEEELEVFRLQSKTMMDVPVIAPCGAVVHMICSHPTPPVFDGPEDRNGKRNHDEIRMIADYLSGKGYLKDDEGDATALGVDALFFVLGDLNADPDEGDSFNRAIGQLLDHPRMGLSIAPAMEQNFRDGERYDMDDTSSFGMRVDYVLPSEGLRWVGARVAPRLSDLDKMHEMRIDGQDHPPVVCPSDHFPVYVDVLVPAKGRGAGGGT